MEKQTLSVYCYEENCIDCKKRFKIYYTLDDFGHAPILRKCKQCNTYYCYTLEDENYIMPIQEKIVGLKCEICGIPLVESLVPTHKSINCCGNTFSLDDNFAGNKIPADNEMVDLVVYMIY